MRVPEEDIAALFREKFPDGIPPCSLCGTDHWFFDDVLYELREAQVQRQLAREEAKVFPVLVLTCSNCGNSHLINALVTKIVVPTGGGQQP
jgi:ribosome biogenesis GTPase A